MRHIMIATALLAFAGLDLVFVRFSDTPAAALTFAGLSYAILLLLSGSAGRFWVDPGDYSTVPGRYLEPEMLRFPIRIPVAASIPIGLLLVLAFIPDLDDPLDPSETVQLGSTFAVFWLLMSLALVGAVLGFLWPKTGALEAVLVGGMVVLAQCLLSLVKVDASRGAVQLALYTWMVWVSISLIGSWVGVTLRQINTFYLFQARKGGPERQNT